VFSQSPEPHVTLAHIVSNLIGERSREKLTVQKAVHEGQLPRIATRETTTECSRATVNGAISTEVAKFRNREAQWGVKLPLRASELVLASE